MNLKSGMYIRSKKWSNKFSFKIEEVNDYNDNVLHVYGIIQESGVNQFRDRYYISKVNTEWVIVGRYIANATLNTGGNV